MAKPNWKKILGVVFIFSACVFSFKIGFEFISKSNNRNPAATPGIYDFSKLEGTDWKTAVQDRLILGTNVIRAGNSVGLEFGHFLTNNKIGAPVSVCDVYGEIEVIFEATNMAISGEPPLMIVHGFCEPSSNNTSIVPLMIDIAQVLPTNVVDRKFSSVSGGRTSVSFKNVSDIWPDSWILRTVRLYNTDAEIKLETSDYRRFLGKIITLEFQ